MKITNKIMAALFSLVLVAAATGSFGRGASENVILGQEGERNTITVNGTGKVTVTPNIAYISLGVQTEASDAKDAQSANTVKMNAVISALKAVGIADKDLQTNAYNIYPVYSYNEQNSANTIKGYSVSNSVSVTVRDINKLGEVIDAATGAGANTSNGVQFSISDEEKYYGEALNSAIGQGERKAKSISQTIGATIGNPISVIESGSVQPYSVSMLRESANYDMSSTPISIGQVEVTAQVTMVYTY